VKRKTVASFTLYEQAVRQQRQTLIVPVILASGGLLSSATDYVWTLGRENPNRDFQQDCATIVVAHQRALARVLLHHADQSFRMRPLPSAAASRPTAASQAVLLTADGLDAYIATTLDPSDGDPDADERVEREQPLSAPSATAAAENATVVSSFSSVSVSAFPLDFSSSLPSFNSFSLLGSDAGRGAGSPRCPAVRLV